MARVCKRCMDPNVRITPHLAAGQPFHPQTCARPSAAAVKTSHGSFGAAAVAEHLMDRIQVDHDAVVETKFDGWRLSVHVVDDGGVQSVRCAVLNHPSLPLGPANSSFVCCHSYLADLNHRAEPHGAHSWWLLG